MASTRIIPTCTCLFFAVILCCLSASIVTQQVTAFNPSFAKGSAPTKPVVTAAETDSSSADSATPPPPTVPASPVEGAAAAPAVVAVVEGAAAASTTEGATASTSTSASPAAKQSDFGTTLELPSSYASCGQCGAAFALTEEAMGPAKGGRYVYIVFELN
jgi:hypothetical protein